jgi:hypothetical protein
MARLGTTLLVRESACVWGVEWCGANGKIETHV